MKKNKTPEQEDIEKDVERYSAIKAISEQEGGIVIVDSHLRDIADGVNLLVSNYKTLSHMEMISHLADMKSKLDMVKIFRRSATNAQSAREALEKSLKGEG